MITQKLKNVVLVVSLVAGANSFVSAMPFNPETLLDGSAITRITGVANRMFVNMLIKTLEAVEPLNTEEIVSKDEPLEIQVTLDENSTFRFVLPSATKLPVFIKVAKRLVAVSEELTKAVNDHLLNLLNETKQIFGEESVQDIKELLTVKEKVQPAETIEMVETQTESPVQDAQ